MDDIDPKTTDINLTDPPSPAFDPNPKPDEPLIAGKFKSVDDLVKSYKELESKLGTEPPAPDATPSKPDEPKTPSGITVAGLPADKYFDEYKQSGTLSEDSYKELADKGVSKELVDAYIAGQQALAARQSDLSDKTVKDLIEGVGGQTIFDKMVDWANAGGFTEQDKTVYTKAVESGDPELARLALDKLQSKYKAAFGTAPKLLEGNPAPVTSGYRSKAEMVAAMKDPRYKLDDAYRRDVELKVAHMQL